jgi:hypothetical protein
MGSLPNDRENGTQRAIMKIRGEFSFAAGLVPKLVGFCLILWCIVLCGTAAAAEFDVSWNGGAGNWSDPTKWDGGVVPNNGAGNTFNVSIDGGNSVNSAVTLDIAATVSKLTIDSGDQLSHVDGRVLTVAGGPVSDNGVWALNTTGAATGISFYGGVTLSGSGSIVMNNALLLNNLILTDNTVLTQAAGHTIRGSGQLLADSGGMLNQGTVIADQPNGLVIDPNDLGFSNAGTVQVTGTSSITVNAGPFTTSGAVLIDPGTTLTRTGDYTQTAGTTTLNGGTLSATGLVDIQSGELLGTGTISAAVNNAGEVSPGLPAGTLNITGSYAQTSTGTLHIEIRGPEPGSFGRLVVTGAVTLNGTLTIALADDFRPSLNSTFEILTFGQRTGQFAQTNGLVQANGVTFFPLYSASSLSFKVIQEAFTPTQTSTPSETPTPTDTATVTCTPTETPTYSVTPTATQTPTPSSTATPLPCVGDCGGDDVVTVDEILTMVNIALGNTPVADCVPGDRNGDGTITVDEILAAVGKALAGCS